MTFTPRTFSSDDFGFEKYNARNSFRGCVMQRLLLRSVLFLLISSAALFAQGRFGSRTSPQTSGGINPNPDGNNPGNSGMQQTAFISGKVTIDDGTELSEPVAIQTICRGQRHTVTRTSKNGS